MDRRRFLVGSALALAAAVLPRGEDVTTPTTIKAEYLRATAAEKVLTDALAAEKTARIAGDVAHPADALTGDQVKTLLLLAGGSGGGTPTPPPPTDHWAGIAFLSRPSSGALSFDGASDVEITNKTFAGDIYPSSALRFSNCHNIWVHDCDFNNLDWDCIDVLDCTGTLKVEWNRSGVFRYVSAGRRPDFMQLVRSQFGAGSFMSNNKIKTGGQNEDIVSTVDNSGGLPGALLEISYNAIEGGASGSAIPSTSGTGTMCADNSGATAGHIWVHHNTYLNPAQVGIAISEGIDCHVTDNIVYGSQRAGSNVGIYTPYYAPGATNPGGHEVARNRIYWKNAAGSLNPLFDGGASGTVAGLSPQTNVLNDASINPATLAVVL